MLVSWRWLQDYVKLDIGHDELAERLAMSGLNHEGTEAVGDDLAIDLEVTSNRPDCLGHIGVAREAANRKNEPSCSLFVCPLRLLFPRKRSSKKS